MSGANPNRPGASRERKRYSEDKKAITPGTFCSRCKNAQAKKPKDLEKTLRKAHACMMMLSTRKHSNPKTQKPATEKLATLLDFSERVINDNNAKGVGFFFVKSLQLPKAYTIVLVAF